MPEDRIQDILSGGRSYQSAVMAPTPPVPSLTAISPPMTAVQMVNTYFNPTAGGSGGMMGMMGQGLMAARSYNVGQPYSVMGAAMGMPPPYMMTDASMGIYRPGAGLRPPALYSTPGMTGAFHSAADTASQYELMRTGMFADPNQAGANFARMRVAQFGQKYGGWIGTAAGTVGGAMVSGGGMMGMGATLGGAAGDFLGSHIGDIPVVGWAVRKAVELSNIGLTEQLSWMGGSQAGTFGRVGMGGQDIGLGGRGMNAQASLRLGRQMRQMSVESGGQFNQVDMMNILRTAGDSGFLETATNADQVAKTVGNLMKIVGHLGKVMGDPDFRNNLKELGNLRQMGYSVNEALRVLPELNSYSRMAGMTRGQMMQQYGAPGAMQASAAGLTTGVGMAAGMYGGAQAQMLSGSFNEIQKNLLGGDDGIAQRVREQQIAFHSNISPVMVLSLLSAKGGQLGLDKAGIQALMRSGQLDLTRMGGAGAQNIHEVASRVARQKAEQEGRTATMGDVTSAYLEIQGRMKEFQSDFAQQIGPRGTQLLMYNAAENLRKTHGDMGAAVLMSGGDFQQAQVLMAQWRDPTYREKMRGQAEEEHRRLRGEATLGARGRSEARQADTDEWQITKGLRRFSTWIQTPGKLSDGSIRDADDEARRMMHDSDAAAGISRAARVGAAAGVNIALSEDIGKRSKGRSFGINVSGSVTEDEARAYWRRQGVESPSYFTFSDVGEQAYREVTMFSKDYGHLWDEKDKKDVEKRIRRSTEGAQATTEMIDRSRRSTDSSYDAVTSSLRTALGSSSHVVSLQRALRDWASRKGANNRGVDVGEMYEVAMTSMRQIMGPGKEREANAFVRKNLGTFGAWGMRVISEGGDDNAQKALQTAQDEGMLSKNFGITEKGDKAIKQGENILLEALTGAGAMGGEFVSYGDTGQTEFVANKELSQEQREAYRRFQDAGTGKEGSQKRMMTMLLARSAGGEGVSDADKRRAEEMLVDIETSGDPASKKLLRQLRGEMDKSDAGGKLRGAQSGLLSASAREMGIDLSKGTGTELLGKLVSGDTGAQEGGAGWRMYAPNKAELAARSLEGIRSDIKTAREKLDTNKEAKDEKSLLEKQVNLADYVKSIADMWLEAANRMPMPS